MFVPARPILIEIFEKRLIYQHVYPVLQFLMRDGCIVFKNQTSELMLSLDGRSKILVEANHIFLQQFRAVFQNPHFIYTCATVYER